jgi:hypothetical protein
MKKTRLNSVVFVIICSLLLLVAVGGIILYGFSMYRHTHQIGTLIASAIGAIVMSVCGSALAFHAHEDIFANIPILCEGCNESFERTQVEKQIEHTVYGKMYVEHRCPYCKASLIGS